MAALMSLRATPSLRSTGPQRQAAQPISCSFGRCRPSFRTHAFYGNGAWDEGSADAMKQMLEDMAKHWREQQGAVGRPFCCPGGRHMHGAGRGHGQHCKHSGSTQQQRHGEHSGQASSPQLPLDVAANEDFYLLFADVPGLAKSDLSIKLSKERVLTIAGERKAPLEDKSVFAQAERAFGPFERAWTLPDDAESEGISAKVSEGVLTIRLPRKQPEPEVDDAQDIFIS